MQLIREQIPVFINSKSLKQLICVLWVGLLAPLALFAQTPGPANPATAPSAAPASETPSLTELAGQGHPVAQFNLGIHFDQGLGVAQDFAQAAKWYRLAAQQGHAGAQFNLGGLYAQGQGLPQDLVRAGVWFTLAATGGYPGASRNRHAVAQALNPLQQARVEQLARDCMRQRYVNCD